MAFSLADALRWFHGGDKKAKPAFKSEREAYDFLRNLYKKTGGVTPELRRTYEFYQKQVDDCEPTAGPRAPAGYSARK
ncbi:hypothetical protein GCM10011321_14860 [Youhaiella tibetensis]|nr:hypothetical protein GCM10011321_14860 [Youhaiella tibetensis]